MISRTTLFLDRIATLILALVLITAGALGVWWSTGNSSLPDDTDTTSIIHTINQPWWPWASAIAGIILIVLGLSWIATHLRSTKIHNLYLSGTSAQGKLKVDGSHLADVAATALADTIGVRRSSGVIHRNRGQLVANLHVVIEPEADLTLIAQKADQISSQLAHALSRNDLRASIDLIVAHRGNHLPRVN